MTSNTMTGGGFMENPNDLHEFMDNNSANMGGGSNPSQQQMSSNPSQKSHFGPQGNGSTNQFMNNQFNQVSFRKH